MSLKISVYSDYVCPFCYLAKAPFEEAIRGKDVEVEWKPFELRPSPAPQLDPVNDPQKRAAWDSYIAPAAAKWGVEMKLPNVSPHPYTGLAFEGFHFAAAKGKGEAYNNRIFKAFFQEEQNIGELDILTRLAGEIGLDEAEFRQALQAGTYRDAQREALQHAFEEARITAVPTFIIGEERLQGAAGKDVFEQVLAKELSKRTADAPAGLSCDVNGSC
ncbi:DsbA family oxidoreductase [Paenibacillus beijingensis]|uniref:DSBA-like thioredoxin domain-containing protein n=1 Tax=Paenibacillus beijingensis TaxID=1126833 RepID=A0A0D5NK42_9BACL|nr:DsbA family oxidoreductase [Paenibacillus beijingensis]AJY75377.1 hypothetical protein VN24_13365 [Paenibacillus beijingensis]